MMDRQVTQRQVTADQTQTQTSNTITISDEYNTMGSQQVLNNERYNSQQFDTYADIIIKKFINDKITFDELQNMIKQLCSLAEYIWQKQPSIGELRKHNVKLRLANALGNNGSISYQIAYTLLDNMIDETIKNNTKRQLKQIACNLLKVSVKASGLFEQCLK
ncbi:Conserved_hypothetical protein [Hexamita inflata]|uniref:Uncharacterized protein n=1 Tax=Hexamita inflata TaxID=28002 RepID=A0AA86PEY1_9EUKA|nr:Conserved hypothetical protein [Hexamita inflata]CAI9936123.1 Conserved hypothetical protein [Hexamita inflata]